MPALFETELKMENGVDKKLPTNINQLGFYEPNSFRNANTK